MATGLPQHLVRAYAATVLPNLPVQLSRPQRRLLRAADRLAVACLVRGWIASLLDSSSPHGSASCRQRLPPLP
jgi:hypothetical protein